MSNLVSLNDNPNPSWDEVSSSISNLQSQSEGSYLNLSVNGDVWFVLYFIPDYGYYLSGSATDDVDYYTLTDSSLGDKPSQVWCGGDHMTRPRKAFVGESLVRQALRHFFDTGFRDTALEWEVDDSLSQQ